MENSAENGHHSSITQHKMTRQQQRAGSPSDGSLPEIMTFTFRTSVGRRDVERALDEAGH